MESATLVIPASILIAIIGWLVVDKIKTQNKKDVEQDEKLKSLSDAISGIYELLYKHQRDIEWLIKGNGK